MLINEYFLFHQYILKGRIYNFFKIKVCQKINLKMKNLQKKQKVLKS